MKDLKDMVIEKMVITRDTEEKYASLIEDNIYYIQIN